jgi:hypothetical protein
VGEILPVMIPRWARNDPNQVPSTQDSKESTLSPVIDYFGFYPIPVIDYFGFYSMPVLFIFLLLSFVFARGWALAPIRISGGRKQDRIFKKEVLPVQI